MTASRVCLFNEETSSDAAATDLVVVGEYDGAAVEASSVLGGSDGGGLIMDPGYSAEELDVREMYAYADSFREASC